MRVRVIRVEEMVGRMYATRFNYVRKPVSDSAQRHALTQRADLLYPACYITPSGKSVDNSRRG